MHALRFEAFIDAPPVRLLKFGLVLLHVYIRVEVDFSNYFMILGTGGEVFVLVEGVQEVRSEPVDHRGRFKIVLESG